MARAVAHAAAAAGRCRRGQDGRRDAGAAERGRSGRAGRADGADGNPLRASTWRRSNRWRKRRACAWRCSRAANAAPPRDQTLAALANGEIDILVGTHALFSEDVAFRDLGLAVVDEQHRFGVHQRMQLQGKGERPADVLVMTATPIPRTLALTAYGDMDVSRLTGRPPGRKPVETRVLSDDAAGRSDRASAPRASRKARAPIGCARWSRNPRIIDLAAAEERAAMLKQALGPKVGLVHGR